MRHREQIMALSRLNDDVMHLIMDRADRPAISKMMRTCRRRYLDGARYLLKDPVYLHPDWVRQVESFVDFMKADNRRRFPFLRSLYIGTKEYDPEETPSNPAFALSGPHMALLEDFFATLGAQGINLTQLIFHEAEDILVAHPALEDAIASLCTVTDLEISRVGRRASNMLRNFRSRLEYATITTCDVEQDPTMSAEDRNALLLFQNSQSTLVQLKGVDITSSFGGPRYLNLTVLIITHNYTLFTHHYFHACPNLLALYISDCMLTGAETSEELDLLRQTNIAAQRLHGTWKSLHRFNGSAPMLYALGLTCPIKRLEFGYDPEYDADPRMLRTVIGDARPTHLTVHVLHAYELLETDLAAVLSEPHARQVQSLGLYVSFTLHDLWRGYEAGLVFSVIQDIVRVSAASTLNLTISWMDFSPDVVRSKFLVSPTDQIPLEVELEKWDYGALADALLASTKSLRKVTITLLRTREQIDKGRRRIVRRKVDDDGRNADAVLGMEDTDE
ncbi:hypothetical protein C8Q76DRAFT_797433 [Earliella scabrosa]|nr:hypothetical protein C8Q76DRAFT_797433 [Earliella scabrosa]